MAFNDTVGPSLRQARQLCQRHIIEDDQNAFDQAWELYLKVWHRLDTHGPELDAPRGKQDPKVLDLQFVSPRLSKASDLELAVPGEW